MQNLNSVYDLSNQLSDDILCKLYLLFFEVEKYISLIQILHNDVDFGLVLKGFPDSHEDVLTADLLNEFTLH
jgi:hypothetical protein